MIISKIDFRPQLMSSVVQKRNQKSESYAHSNIITLSSPCDSNYLIGKNNVNFCGKYNIKKISAEELQKLQKEINNTIHNFGGHPLNYYVSKYFDYNYVTQAIHKLMEHKIMSIEKCRNSIIERLPDIQSGIVTNHYQNKQNSEAILDIADALTSKNAKKILSDKSVQENAGDILWWTNHENIQGKIKFIDYLAQNYEQIKGKNVDLGKYIAKADENLNDELTKLLNQPKPPKDPTDNLDIINHRQYIISKDKDGNIYLKNTKKQC